MGAITATTSCIFGNVSVNATSVPPLPLARIPLVDEHPLRVLGVEREPGGLTRSVISTSFSLCLLPGIHPAEWKVEPTWLGSPPVHSIV